MMFRIGIDLGGTNIAVGIVDEQYNILCTAHTPTRTDRGAEGIIDDMIMCISNALNELGEDLGNCRGIGIGSPGTCDNSSGTVRNAHNLGLYGVPLRDMLSRRIGLRVELGNDADCAALGEVVAGAARGSHSALMITLGTGVGGGYVLEGRISSGYRGLGGEFGHICVAMDGEKCTCGQRGCWEAYASASALIRQGKKAAAENPGSALCGAGELDGRKIYACAARGDETAKAVVAQYARYVGVGLTSLANAIFPETILIGGGVSGAGDALMEPVREYVRDNFFVADPALAPEIKLASLGNDAGIIGAAALVE